MLVLQRIKQRWKKWENIEGRKMWAPEARTSLESKMDGHRLSC